MSADELFAELGTDRHRRALGRAITLLESERPQDRETADRLTELAARNGGPEALRIGISGTPGVGKSTFIERFGLELVGAGHRVAVLAVDPTSSLSGGSILGDKTRMAELGRSDRAYIRPSPSSGYLGGVGPASRATILLCGAAGYDRVIVETVGVGQAEWQVHGMTDVFLLLAQPAAGDELQGIKRGILELADLVVVNKADLLPDAARQTAQELRRSLHLAPAREDAWTVPVLLGSALTGQGMDKIIGVLGEYSEISPELGSRRRAGAKISDSDRIGRRRAAQVETWLRERCAHQLQRQLTSYLDRRREQTDEFRSLLDERTTLSSAADVLLADFLQNVNLSDT